MRGWVPRSIRDGQRTVVEVEQLLHLDERPAVHVDVEARFVRDCFEVAHHLDLLVGRLQLAHVELHLSSGGSTGLI